ncbi:hypothetical protein G6011_02811 [Alternaria panax]|uniref:DUF7703 domain-containing protein n=1 Tax=Alternaria panax TaxID=48097 RepID=A0AAD4I271_9PLEO|nr:hypothetical protein G6011_02811 [Alternaria panax]
MAWFNGAELLVTIPLTFKRWSGKYFYCLLVATLGVLVYQINVLLMIFAPYPNAYGVIASIGLGWSAMVTDQSLVLWSRLHLVCRSVWKLRLILCMIVFNGLSMHGPQFTLSLLAVRNNAIDPNYKPFALMEKISVVILTVQEIIISMVYLMAAVRILQVGETLQKKGNRRRVQLLFLANVVIICIDVCTVTLEHMALWGVWCSFKGFGYSVKLKVEFAILSQLRDSVKGSNGSSFDIQPSLKITEISLQDRNQHNIESAMHSSRLYAKRQAFEHILDVGSIEKRTDIDVQHEICGFTMHQDLHADIVKQVDTSRVPPSQCSSEIDFASRGV